MTALFLAALLTAPAMATEPPSLTDALECRLPAAQAETVLAGYGITVDAPAVQFGTLVTAYGIPVMNIEATREAGGLHVYYVIAAPALRPFIDAAGMETIGHGYVRTFLQDRNGLQAINPAEIRKRHANIAPIYCEMRA